ncbi:alkyl sulfatase dimerization domain-containing protein [Streptomyces sp. NPDC093228]|uniref:alkyl/aryl-sulfatase n=1 Tax=unclassified Streptomyces TaxID=2593676 RepID=UPI00074123BD|nr:MULTISPECIES: alkyl sulfatase dimerization domain-containing protein [unclassified Streptomyces]KUJ37904.1 alkyl sulfatase [Streptomyces sp. NRRL F-5122]MDX3258879.1 alkyl sulfatase dimerization domain-containing protein [Streptomyces sp. MI02-2A]REE62262.1 alkyl sulfatase BDS1-like metallo-beta-lactamase superfamily hydrolase [Streptomyces sp. 3212.3]
MDAAPHDGLPPFEDRTDFENADRGFVSALVPGVVTADDGRVVWDADAYGFLDGDCPATAHPGLWRQSQLCARQGLYEVTEGVYQVRGLDLANMTLVEGHDGVLVVDPLVSSECAAAALALYRRHRGERPVTGLIYTHSHVDHFGGARGVLPPDAEWGVPVLAPVGFLEHAVSENVFAGPAIARRADFMYGASLPKAPDGQIGTGLGSTVSTGTVTLVPPTVDITHSGQTEVVDGVRILFQLTPGTEAPAEMNFLFTEQRALCLAENVTHTLHNILTLRGALVRDARIWSRYLDEAIDFFGDAYDVAFASHHWPTWGHENVVRLLAEQRDLYAYLHDQTLRLLNSGLTGPEIAEELRLPPALEAAWHARGYYGSLNHNVKAVYQRYLGWYDGNPAHLWEHPPVPLAERYVEMAGGPTAMLAAARRYADAGDLRFAATLLNHLVFAEPGDEEARRTLAGVYERLGHGSENGPWRNIYLTGAQELLAETGGPAVTTDSAELTSALSVGMLLDSLAVRIDGPRAAREPRLIIDLVVIDEQRRHRINLEHGALTHRSLPLHRTPRPQAGLTLTLTRPELLGLFAGKGLAGIGTEGDRELLKRLFSHVSRPDRGFPIVTP